MYGSWLWTSWCHVEDEIKTNNIKIVQSKQWSDPASEKMRNHDTENLT